MTLKTMKREVKNTYFWRVRYGKMPRGKMGDVVDKRD
jgi:hypothetical protein